MGFYVTSRWARSKRANPRAASGYPIDFGTPEKTGIRDE